jgi:hypothetical protein
MEFINDISSLIVFGVAGFFVLKYVGKFLFCALGFYD